LLNLPVLLLPGTLCTGAIFDQQKKALKPLSPRIEVVQFRQERSIGEMAETVAERIPRDTGAAIAGFSMGGMVAMALACTHPHLVSKLALINTNSHAELPERHATRVEHLAEARKTGVGKVIARHYLSRYLQRQRPEYRQLITAMADELGVDCFEAQARALATRGDSNDILKSIDCPTLILGSSEDVLCPPQEQMSMHRKVRHSDLVLLGGCGHFSMLERPEAVNSSLCNWYLEKNQSL